QEIKARMTYKYPENRPFRFPVIPDPMENREKNEYKPAYVRRNQESVQPAQPKKEKKASSPTPVRKVYKDENAPPFQASDVPSPIYGFQKRDNEVENVPAYARKKAKKEERSEVQIEEIEEQIKEQK